MVQSFLQSGSQVGDLEKQIETLWGMLDEALRLKHEKDLVGTGSDSAAAQKKEQLSRLIYRET